MKKETYLWLISCRFLDGHGGLKTYYSADDRPYDFKKVTEVLYAQMNEDIDLHNVIISFPTGSGLGCSGTGLFGPGNIGDPRRVLLDHCTYPIDVARILDNAGVRYKNGDRLTNRKYSQRFLSMLVVQDGVAYAVSGGRSYLHKSHPWHDSLYFSDDRDPNTHLINWNDRDVLNFEDKQIVFSGFLVRRHREGTLATDSYKTSHKQMIGK